MYFFNSHLKLFFQWPLFQKLFVCQLCSFLKESWYGSCLKFLTATSTWNSQFFFFFFFKEFKQCSPETQMVGIFHDHLFQYYRLLWFIKAITKIPILIRNKFKPIQLAFVHAYGWLRKQFLEKVVAVHV